MKRYKRVIKCEFIPIDADGRGYTDTFECSHCHCWITYHIPTKDLDYNFCPQCGAKCSDETGYKE